MSGGITQLVALGAQDSHLVGSPEVSFFQSSYKRHSNFSSVIERQVLQNTPRAGGLSSVRFERKGDLLSYVYLTESTAGTGTARAPYWNTLIDKVELYIGGQLIDTQWMDSNSIYNDVLASSMSRSTLGPAPGHSNDFDAYFYPFRFWFCENWQSALPLIALQYHDVECRIYWKDGGSFNQTIEVWARYVYLDKDERRMMAERKSEYLIQQLQRIPASGSRTMDLTFNHPVKCLVGISPSSFKNLNTEILLQLNGTDVGEKKNIVPHYKQVSSYYHTMHGVSAVNNLNAFDNVAFVVPFCLDASKLQPTGTCNFSRMDSARIQLFGLNSTSPVFDGPVYAVNYNILSIQNGMGGLLYAN